jgi:hypothetical protein
MGLRLIRLGMFRFSSRKPRGKKLALMSGSDHPIVVNEIGKRTPLIPAVQ